MLSLEQFKLASKNALTAFNKQLLKTNQKGSPSFSTKDTETVYADVFNYTFKKQDKTIMFHITNLFCKVQNKERVIIVKVDLDTNTNTILFESNDTPFDIIESSIVDDLVTLYSLKYDLIK